MYIRVSHNTGRSIEISTDTLGKKIIKSVAFYHHTGRSIEISIDPLG